MRLHRHGLLDTHTHPFIAQLVVACLALLRHEHPPRLTWHIANHSSDHKSWSLFFILCLCKRCTQRRENQRLPPNPRHPDSRWVSAASPVGRTSATCAHLSSISRCRQSPRKCHSLIHSSWAFFIHPMPALTLSKSCCCCGRACGADMDAAPEASGQVRARGWEDVSRVE